MCTHNSLEIRHAFASIRAGQFSFVTGRDMFYWRHWRNDGMHVCNTHKDRTHVHVKAQDEIKMQSHLGIDTEK